MTDEQLREWVQRASTLLSNVSAPLTTERCYLIGALHWIERLEKHVTELRSEHVEVVGEMHHALALCRAIRGRGEE